VNKDQIIGVGLLIAAIIVTIVYVWLVFFTPYDIFVLKITGAVAIAAIFGIIGWIGYTLATTPPPKPIEEIEKELEEELKKLEKEVGGKEGKKTTSAKSSEGERK